MIAPYLATLVRMGGSGEVFTLGLEIPQRIASALHVIERARTRRDAL